MKRQQVELMTRSGCTEFEEFDEAFLFIVYENKCTDFEGRRTYRAYLVRN